MAQFGELAAIARREKPFAPMEEADHCTVGADGVEGDWRSVHAEEDRAVVLLFEDQWREVCEELGQTLRWTARRGNFLVRGIPNPGASVQRIRIGKKLVLEVTGVCDPCSRMDRACQGLRRTLEMHGRGGLICRVIEGGSVAVGDTVAVVGPRSGAEAGKYGETPSDVVRFWFEEVPPKKRFQVDPDLDKVIRERFSMLRNRALAGELDSWEENAEGALALLILLDQFSRNLFRGNGRAFEADAVARAIADRSIARGHDRAVGEEMRAFFYLPFMHSENLLDQDRCLELFRTNLPSNELALYHAEKHREVIERFGRFPYRNKAMGRTTTAEEEAFLAGGGYVP